ncbi:MAG: aminotransferase class IV [Planctomycetes bacterium]|nr:aminotransferase class IV [Planctomycetota bacterium]
MKQSFNPKNADLIVNINGELVHRNEAKVSVFDSLVQGGDGCWEGLRVYQGRIFRLEQHLNRLRHSALALNIEGMPDAMEIRRQIQRTLETNEMHDNAHIRLTLSRGEKITSGMDPRLNQKGPTLIVLAEHKAPVYEKTGLKLITSSVRRFPPDCMDPKIHHNNLIQSIMAKIEANAAGADDAMMLDTRGFVAETNATHLFMVEDGVIKTPHTHACPEGVTRSTVLALCKEHQLPHQIINLSQAEFYRADEVFCSGTMGELAFIGEIDGRTIGNGEMGPLTARLSEMYGELTRNQSEEILPR